MPLKVTLALGALFLGACSAVKYNSHIGSDGQNGYLRTYYASGKERANGRTEGTGIEQCKVQGSDIICKDLNVIHADENARPAAEGKPEMPKADPPAKPAAAAVPVTPAAPAKPAPAPPKK